MFGIKTRKDKRIEELERRNNELITALTLRLYMAETSSRDIQIYEYSTILEDGEPVDWAKERIAMEFRFMIRDDICFEIYTDDNTGENILHGRIGVLKRLGGKNNANR